MTSEKRQYTPPDALRTEPSVALWSTELCELLDGERAADIEHLADAAEYTEGQVKRSSRECESRAYLVEALDSIITGWNAGPDDSPETQSLYLDLLRRYTPPSGFLKLVLFVERQNVHHVASPEYQRVVRLQRKAFHAMERYFPAAPTSSEGSPTARELAFRKYVALLTNLRSHPDHAAYGMRTLFKIGVLPLDGDDIVRALTDYPRGIRGILQYLLEPEHRAQAATDLGRLYNVCLSLRVPAEKHFRRELESLGGRFKDAIGGPRVVAPRSSEEILLEIQQEERCVEYSELCEQRSKVPPQETVGQLLKTVYKTIAARKGK